MSSRGAMQKPQVCHAFAGVFEKAVCGYAEGMEISRSTPLEPRQAITPVFGRVVARDVPTPDVPIDDVGRAARFMPHIVREGVFAPQELAVRAGMVEQRTRARETPPPDCHAEERADIAKGKALREAEARQAYLRHKYPIQAPLLDMLG